MTRCRKMVLHQAGRPLELEEASVPTPKRGQLLIKVSACAVCRTDLHVVDGDLTSPKLPLVPGHEIVGQVRAVGAGVDDFKPGDRVGVPWLGYTCGSCRFCLAGRENLCADAQFTGYTIDGGFADFTLADARYCFPIPAIYSDAEAAPLMCAGLIGFRSLRAAGNAKRLGVYGFGAAAHIITQVAVHQGREVFAFTKPEDTRGQNFAKEMGAVWAGGSQDHPPVNLEAAIIFAPVGALVPAALRAVDKGGTVVCAGIHMSDIPSFPYKDLWEERTLKSVANLTREDGVAFLNVAPAVPVRTSTHTYSLAEANTALSDLRNGRFEGAAVLMMDQ